MFTGENTGRWTVPESNRALWLESYTGLIVGLGSLIWIIGRIVVEERMLRDTLPGYSEYVENVPYRLVPFVW